MDDNIELEKDEILEKFGGDEGFLTEIIEIFLDDTPKQLSKIKKAINNLNSKELEQSAHKLKGAIANFVENTAFKTALKLEIMGRENRFDGVEDVFDTLVKDVECLANELKECIE
ncbi:PAS sensor protein [Candidatus Scalindua japonica]|uniref:PAS sensor protein n=1 Tax=Candidatus Scalindua japonica TaxID=1284222 RepID=A0A286TZ11_9BACT|nr:Hpt domain-containing protein [Candidatus Scalindua japonica]GAX61098.1 PAS sensor protein [Candidatus Scalindua japonica]